MPKPRSNSSDAMLKFLKKQVGSKQDPSPQNSTGNLYRLLSKMRTKYGRPVWSFKMFVQQFTNVFAIREHSNLHVLTKYRQPAPSINSNAERFRASTSDRGTDEENFDSPTDAAVG